MRLTQRLKAWLFEPCPYTAVLSDEDNTTDEKPEPERVAYETPGEFEQVTSLLARYDRYRRMFDLSLHQMKTFRIAAMISRAGEFNRFMIDVGAVQSILVNRGEDEATIVFAGPSILARESITVHGLQLIDDQRRADEPRPFQSPQSVNSGDTLHLVYHVKCLGFP